MKRLRAKLEVGCVELEEVWMRKNVKLC